MTGTSSGEERELQVERYRLLAREITDPLAAGLLRDIISEMEAAALEKLGEESEKMARLMPWSAKRRPA